MSETDLADGDDDDDEEEEEEEDEDVHVFACFFDIIYLVL